jgi:hypothetical protein
MKDKMSSPNYKPFMAYLSPKDIINLKKFSKTSRVPMSQIIREAVSGRLASGNPYTAGFNAGLQKAISVVGNIQAAQMRFPSGLSFAELVDAEVCKQIIQEEAQHETDRST